MHTIKLLRLNSLLICLSPPLDASKTLQGPLYCIDTCVVKMEMRVDSASCNCDASRSGTEDDRKALGERLEAIQRAS